MKISNLIILLAVMMSSAIFPQGYLALVGGGSENYNSWSDIPYGWMVEKGDSGKVLVLSYRDESNWMPDYFLSLGAAQASNLKIASVAQANDSAVYNAILDANVLFLKGGNQFQYYSQWRNTLAAQAIAAVYQGGGVLGGTSAGAMVLSEIVFTAQNGTVYPEEVLRNPYDFHVTLKNDFFSFLPDIFVDTHVIERGRVGRMLGILARWNQDHAADILTIGIDDRTALLVNPDLTATPAGSGAVTFLWQSTESEVICAAGQPLHFTHVNGSQLTAGFRFDLSSRTVTSVPSGATAVPTIAPDDQLPPTDIWLQGGDDFSYQSAPGGLLSQFLQENPAVEKITILSDINGNAVNRAQMYRDWFLAQGVDSAWVQSIYIGNVNDPAVVARVDAADALVLAGNHELFVGDLLNGANDLSQHFAGKMAAGAPLLAIGVDARMVSNQFVGATESSSSNLFYGNLKWVGGATVWQNVNVMTKGFEDHDYKENRVGGFFWGSFKSPKSLGVLLDEGTTLVVRDSMVDISGEAPAIFVDAANASYIDSSIVAFGSKPRQCVAIDKYTWHVIAPEKSFAWMQRQPFITSLSPQPATTIPERFQVYSAYPNPFNGEVHFRMHLTHHRPVSVSIFDLLGRQVASIQLFPANAGQNTWRWQPESRISSGAYFFHFQQGESFATQIVHYLK